MDEKFLHTAAYAFEGGKECFSSMMTRYRTLVSRFQNQNMVTFIMCKNTRTPCVFVGENCRGIVNIHKAMLQENNRGLWFLLSAILAPSSFILFFRELSLEKVYRFVSKQSIPVNFL